MAATIGVGCSGNDRDPPEDSEAVTGQGNRLGLRVAYDETTNHLDARTNRPLEDGERLFVRVRRGSLSEQTQRTLSCAELADQPGAAAPATRTDPRRFDGPEVPPELLSLQRMFASELWRTGPFTEAMREEIRKGADAIVEACVTKDDRVRAKIQTTLWYAIDLGHENASPERDLGTTRLRLEAAGADAGHSQPREGVALHSVEKYADLCVQELGEIPFFRKKSDGHYDTFDCRDFKASDGTEIPEVEGATIPMTVDDTPRAECDREKPHQDADTATNYDCANKCDKPQNLFKVCEPGPTVSTAKNNQGTHWVLLCRAADVETGSNRSPGVMLKTKMFRDIAMIGHNPNTGKTCFFQNDLGKKYDGANVSHPADVDKSKNIWKPTPQGYCMESCHAADAFVHSPWIDGALRRNGTPIVPKLGSHDDFKISWLDAPYYVVNMDAQAKKQVGGFSWAIGDQLVSEEAAPCTGCHRIAGDKMMSLFTSYGTSSPHRDSRPFFNKVTDSYKNSFAKSHWMPTGIDGWTQADWNASKWKTATDHIIACGRNTGAPGCEFAKVPRGPLNPPAPH